MSINEDYGDQGSDKDGMRIDEDEAIRDLIRIVFDEDQ